MVGLHYTTLSEPLACKDKTCPAAEVKNSGIQHFRDELGLAAFAADEAKVRSSSEYQNWLRGLDKIRKIVSDRRIVGSLPGAGEELRPPGLFLGWWRSENESSSRTDLSTIPA